MTGNIAHAGIAVALQIVIGVTTGDYRIGFYIGSAYYIGREVAQAEQRYVDKFGSGHTIPWWQGKHPRLWNAKGILDWVYPLLVTGAVAALA